MRYSRSLVMRDPRVYGLDVFADRAGLHGATAGRLPFMS